MAIRLGDLLISKQVITPAQLEEALHAQQIFGGKLGTNLIELGYLTEQALAQFLSTQLGLPAVHAHEVDAIPQPVIELISPMLAEKFRIIPLSLEKRKLRVATADPLDIRPIDEIGFKTGFSCQTVVAPELLITYALEKYYGVKRKARYVRLTGTAKVEYQVTDDVSQPIEYNQRVLDETSRPTTDEVPIVQASESPEAKKWEAALPQLANATDQHKVLEAVVQFAQQDFSRIVIFAIRGDTVAGYRQAGPNLSDELVRQISFGSADCPPILAALASADPRFIAFGKTPSENWLVNSLKLPEPNAVMLAPIIVNGSPIGLVLASGLRDAQPQWTAIRYAEFMHRVAYAMQMVMLKRRIMAPVGAA